MTLDEAMQRLEIFAKQQMNDDMETAIRTVLDNMKKRVEVVTCADCKLNMTENCSMSWGYIDAYGEKSGQRWNKEDDFCSWGERK